MTAVLGRGAGGFDACSGESHSGEPGPPGETQSRVAPAHGLFLKSVLYEGLGKKVT